MKFHRISTSLVLAIAFAGSAFVTPAPSRADQPTYTRDALAYQTAGENLTSRAGTVDKFLGSPSGLAAWVDDVTKLAQTFDAASHSFWDMIYLDAARNNTSFCDTYHAQLSGSWGSGYGIQALSDDYGHNVGKLYDAKVILETSQSKLIEKIATAASNKQKIDPLLNDQLTATRTALAKLDSVYQALLSRNNSLLSNVQATKNALTKPNCGQPTPAPTKQAVAVVTPTPKPATPKPATPAPTPTPAAKLQGIPTGIDRWDGTWVDGPPTTVSCGADLNSGGADLQMRCVVTPKLPSGLNITVEGDFTLLCKLTSPATLTSTCAMTGKWHETNYDANLTGTVALRFDYGRRGIEQQWQLGPEHATRMPPMGTNGPKVAVWGTYRVKGMDVFLHQ
jgi:hypothetical protein